MKLITFIKHFSIAIASLALLSACAISSGVFGSQSRPMSVMQNYSFDQMMKKLAKQVDKRIEAGVPVPYPKDAGGGYTHEQHKQNGKTIYEAGMLFAHTADNKYIEGIRDILIEYADLYPTLGIHPEKKNQSPGKLFWQGLNEAVWLVYAIQGYELVRERLTPEVRQYIEERLFIPMADFLSKENPQTFDRIHNHGTWAAAAVGMTGYVLEQPVRVEQALYGLDRTGDAGFLRQLDLLFSPDGYYAEGPYYQRYALMPFVLFAEAIHRNEPKRRIFDYRDQIILKAIRSTVQQSYDGKFFPINDAIREKGINTVELKYGLSIAYALTKEKDLLGAVMLQNGVVPTMKGKLLLDDIRAGKAKPFEFSSQLFRDGPDGLQGGLAVLRSGVKGEDAAVVLKATTQGLGHGHFDRLGLLYYDDGHEIVADYGAARFLNVEPKYGGRYLPENTSWAKQSIAHNVLVVDETSHFNGNWKEGQKYAPDIRFFGEIEGIQIALAEIDTAYNDVVLQRLVAIVPRDDSPNSYIVDIVQGFGDDNHVFDLPVHFKGQLIETSFEMTHSVTSLYPFGEKNGYQHLWKRSESESLPAHEFASWLLDDQFYTLTFKATNPITAYLTELGANDPDHNLRREQALVFRTNGNTANYVSVHERNGRYDSDEEVTVYDGSSIKDISITVNDDLGFFTITKYNDSKLTFLVANRGGIYTSHSAKIGDREVEWMGPVTIVNW